MSSSIFLSGREIIENRGIGEIGKYPGFYRWYFNKEFLSFLEQVGLPRDLKFLMRERDGQFCYYIGIAKSLNQRMLWHLEQKNTISALSNGVLSTLRHTLLAILGIRYEQSSNALDSFMREWFVECIVCEKKDEAMEIEHRELTHTSQYLYPLNLKENSRLTEIALGPEYLKTMTKLRTQACSVSGHNLLSKQINEARWLDPSLRQLILSQMPINL